MQCLSFQSTQPEWAATVTWLDGGESAFGISIHAARMGCDILRLVQSGGRRNFNPRSPNGLRHGGNGMNKAHYAISIHAARMGCDTIDADYYNNADNISIHAARMGCDTA